MLINSAGVTGMLRVFRMATIMGRYGGGKTSLAVRLAYDLLDSGFCRYLISNVPAVWRDLPENIHLRDDKYLDAVILLDEGGLFLETARDAKKFMNALRKLNCVVLIPSVSPPSSRVKFLTIQRVYNAQFLGLPLWVYSVRLNSGDMKEHEYFAWWKPFEIFGTYATGADGFPVSDLGIAGYLAEQLDIVRSRYPDNVLYSSKILGADDEDEGGGEMMEAAEVIGQAANVIGMSRLIKHVRR